MERLVRSKMTDLMPLKTINDQRGHDLIEYALVAGLIATSAGFLMPNIATSITGLMAKVNSALTSASRGGEVGRPAGRDSQTGAMRSEAWWYRVMYLRTSIQEPRANK